MTLQGFTAAKNVSVYNVFKNPVFVGGKKRIRPCKKDAAE